MNMHRVGDILSCSFEFDCEHEFVDDFGALFTNDVGSYQFVGLSVRD